MKFKDKVAVVTGSSRGIGRTIARHLGQAGVKVVINGRNTDRLEKALSQFQEEDLPVSACSGDLSVETNCRRLVDFTLEKYGRIDFLINNVGIGTRGAFEQTRPEVFRRVFDLNVLTSIYTTLAALPHIEASGGSIVFISSLAGFRGLPNRCPYSMTKMAQTAIAEALKVELCRRSVHVGIVYAGLTLNDPDKKIMLHDGSPYPLVERKKNIFIDDQDYVAKTVLKAIRKRRFKTIVGLKGKAYYFLMKFAPGLVDFIFRNRLKYIKTHDF